MLYGNSRSSCSRSGGPAFVFVCHLFVFGRVKVKITKIIQKSMLPQQPSQARKIGWKWTASGGCKDTKKKNDQTNNNTQLFDGCTCSGWLCCQRNCNCNCNSKRSVASSRRWPGLRCTTFHMSGETSSTSATSFCICCGSWFSHHLQPKRVERHRLAN